MASLKQLLNAYVVGLVLAAASFPATANVVLNVSGGILYGASGVPIGDRLFDVKFVFAAPDLGPDWNPDPGIFFFANGANDGLGQYASQALLTYVLVDGPLGTFDSSPGLTAHCGVLGFDGECNIGTITYFTPTWRTGASTAVNFPGEGDTITYQEGYPFAFHWNYAWTSWSNHAAEPTTIPLLLAAGLAGLGVRARRPF